MEYLDNRFEQGEFCVSEYKTNFQPVDGVCEPCLNNMCIEGRSESLCMIFAACYINLMTCTYMIM